VTGLASLAEGQVHTAIVRQIADTGAVVQIGEISAWLPREEMSWPPVRQPSEVVKAGEEVEVMVLQLDRLRGKVVVGLRRLLADEGADGE
jgi:small subunit ribosomal protein S1